VAESSEVVAVELESSSEVSSDVVAVEPVSVLPAVDEAEDDELDPLLDEAVVCVRVTDVLVPIDPSTATAPNASANAASEAATTRRRIREMRGARARSLAWGSSLGEREGSDMARTVGAAGPFGGDTAQLTAAVKYARAHGGGTIAVSSQQGAAATIIESGTDVAGIGGFSGRESGSASPGSPTWCGPGRSAGC
jgi:hypothetical protein